MSAAHRLLILILSLKRVLIPIFLLNLNSHPHLHRHLVLTQHYPQHHPPCPQHHQEKRLSVGPRNYDKVTPMEHTISCEIENAHAHRVRTTSHPSIMTSTRAMSRVLAFLFLLLRSLPVLPSASLLTTPAPLGRARPLRLRADGSADRLGHFFHFFHLLL